MLASLRKAIKKDRTYFIRAKIDPMFENDRALVDGLLKDIYKEAEKNAQNEFSKLNSDFDLKKIDYLVHNKHISEDVNIKFDEVRQNIQIINNSISSKSYFGYLDALDKIHKTRKILKNIRKILIKDKESLQHNLDFYKSRKQTDEVELRNISNKIKDLSMKSKSKFLIKMVIVYGSALSYFAIYFFNMEPFGGISFLILLIALIKFTFNLSNSETIIGLIPFSIILYSILEFDILGDLFDYIFLIYLISVPFIPDKAIKTELNKQKYAKKNIETQIKTTSVQIEEINNLVKFIGSVLNYDT